MYCHIQLGEQPSMEVYFPGSLPATVIAHPETSYWLAVGERWNGRAWADPIYTDWWSPRPPTGGGLSGGINWVDATTRQEKYSGTYQVALDPVLPSTDGGKYHYFTWWYIWYYGGQYSAWTWFGNVHYNPDVDAYQGWCTFQ